MTKFHGVVGYGDSVEVRPGIWEDVVEERSYYGDVLSIARDLRDEDKVQSDIRNSNSISILADAYAFDHYYNIVYILWNNVAWKVTNVQVSRPRLTLRLGDKYNGPRPEASTP